MLGNKVVVFGASGFVGHAVVNELSKNGFETICCVRRPDRHRALALFPNTKVVQVFDMTIDNIKPVLEGQDIVINLLSDTSLASETPDDLVSVTQNIKKSCNFASIQRILQLSQIGQDEAVKSSSYLASVRNADAEMLKASFAKVTILKAGLLIGEGDETSSRFSQQLDRLPLLPVYHGSTVIQPLNFADFAKAFVQTITDKTLNTQTLELVGEERLTLKELALLVKEMKGKDSAVVMPMCGINAKLMSKLGSFAPICSVSQAQLKVICCDLISDNDFATQFKFEPSSIEMTLSPYVVPHSMRARYNDFRQEAGRDASELI